MLVFVTSDLGGTGRSVTACNIAYRSALRGRAACYVDFDFGSPTAGSIFDIQHAVHGVARNGIHSYLLGTCAAVEPIDVWGNSQRASLRYRPPGAANLTLLPGDEGGSEFPSDPDVLRRCADLFQSLEEQYEVTFVDLSAGRSYATEIALAATATPNLRKVPTRWLVFHRWTRQHVHAAAALVHGKGGILDLAGELGHDRAELEGALRFVRTATIDPSSIELAGLRPAQIVFLRECDGDLIGLASELRVGRSWLLGSTPLEPLLQWREQLISDNDVYDARIANRETVAAFEHLAGAILDDHAWGVV